MKTTRFVVVNQHLRPTPAAEPMQALPFTLSESPDTAETLLQAWVQEFPDSPAVLALTPATRTILLNVFQRILAEKGEVNVDQEDIWGVLAGAAALQFGMATCSGPNRADAIGPRLWQEATVLGNAAIPAQRVLLSVQSGAAPELDMDELSQLVDYLLHQAGDQAEVVFGHGLNPTLGASIQVMMLMSRY